MSLFLTLALLMSFTSYIPTLVLQPYVSSLVISEADAEATYKVLPGTGVVIGFQYKGKLSHVQADVHHVLEPSGVSGLHDSYRVFSNTANTGTCLVYFKEAGAAAFFRQPVHELFGDSVSLDSFMLRSELLTLEDRIYDAATDAARIAIIEEFLIARMRHITPDTLVMNALALIHKSKGSMQVKDMLTQLHASQSALEKRFRQVVGTSPKKFASIVRMKHAIQQYQPQDSLTGLGYEAGFYDQSHFIKAFQHFTGQTPESFFAK